MVLGCASSGGKKIELCTARSSIVDAGPRFPVRTEIADQIERPGNENYVLGRGEFEGAFERVARIGNHLHAPRMMARHFRQYGGGNGARLGWRCKNHRGGAGKK